MIVFDDFFCVTKSCRLGKQEYKFSNVIICCSVA